jgi:MFS family permease
MNGTYGGIYAYTPEIFPTEVRATGVGTASSIGRIGAIVSPILVGWLYPNFGFAGVFGMTTVVLLSAPARSSSWAFPRATARLRKSRRRNWIAPDAARSTSSTISPRHRLRRISR